MSNFYESFFKINITYMRTPVYIGRMIMFVRLSVRSSVANLWILKTNETMSMMVLTSGVSRLKVIGEGHRRLKLF